MRPPRIAILALFFSASLFLFCRSIATLARGGGGGAAGTFGSAAAAAPPPPPPPAAAAAAASMPANSQLPFWAFTTPFTLFPPNAAITLTDDNSTSFPARPAAFGPPLSPRGLSGQLWIGAGFADGGGGSSPDGESEGELGCSDVPGWDDPGTAAFRLGGGAVGSSGGMMKATGHLKHAVVGGGGASSAGPIVGKNTEAGRKRAGLGGGGANGPMSSSGAGPRLLPRAGGVADAGDGLTGKSASAGGPHVDDGTDDYLHQGLGGGAQTGRYGLLHHDGSAAGGSGYGSSSSSSAPAHADIQSIQEAAEIAGKVVLLSRGGCGFLEKVKWAQRRGATALIVGDNQRGGPLIQMFARGDTTNITIPSVFTSRTTAHILSGLMQPGSYIEDTIDERGNAAQKVQQQSDRTRKNKKAKMLATASPTTSVLKATGAAAAAAKLLAKGGGAHSPMTKKSAAKDAADGGGGGWLAGLFVWGRSSSKPVAVRDQGAGTSSRPPSSGRLDWVMVEDWAGDKAKAKKEKSKKSSSSSGGGGGAGAAADPAKPADDSFVIGIQDWRDPDLVGSDAAAVDDPKGSNVKQQPAKGDGSTAAREHAATGAPSTSGKGAAKKPTPGSITTPGSGEYLPATGGASGGAQKAGSSGGSSSSSSSSGAAGGAGAAIVGAAGGGKQPASDGSAGAVTSNNGVGGGLMSKIFGDDDGADFAQGSTDGVQPHPTNLPVVEPPALGGGSALPLGEDPEGGDGGSPGGGGSGGGGGGAGGGNPIGSPPPGSREGLWVTITPTSGASPFFDTLLVLVVSPLITLTVVYALLIVRARIRRRRWRAPKSVVERLPVRTYHTVAPSPGSHSPRLPSPAAASSPTTPLLQRPRSRTTTGVPEVASSSSTAGTTNNDLLSVNDALVQAQAQRSSPPHEKSSGHGGGGSSEWKKYMGRQVECVVCLEEYIDGVSRVMSLPCGHEFHVECITPWLTTRRRTCPICKGDVVRSLARASPNSPRYEPYRDDSDSDPASPGLLEQGAGAGSSGAASGRRSGPADLDGLYASDDDLDLDDDDDDDDDGADDRHRNHRRGRSAQGILSPPPPRRPNNSSRAESWMSILSNGFGAARAANNRSPAAQAATPPDRNR